MTPPSHLMGLGVSFCDSPYERSTLAGNGATTCECVGEIVAHTVSFSRSISVPLLHLFTATGTPSPPARPPLRHILLSVWSVAPGSHSKKEKERRRKDKKKEKKKRTNKQTNNQKRPNKRQGSLKGLPQLNGVACSSGLRCWSLICCCV